MDYVTYESYYLTHDEMNFLLAGKGKKYWFGYIGSGRRDIWTTDEVYKTTVDLYRKGFIRCEKGKVYVVEPMETLVKTVKEAKICILGRVLGRDLQVQCYYVHEGKVVLMERGKTRQDTIRLTLLDKEECLKLFYEEQFFPESVVEETEEKPRRRKKPVQSLYAMLQRINTDDTETTDSITVIEQGLYITMEVTKTGEEPWYAECKRSVWMKVMREWMEEAV